MQRNLTLWLLVCLTLGVRLLARDVAWAATTGRYTGQPISLDLQNAEIGDVFRLIAEVSGLNIIVAPEVQGTVTTRLINVPWDQALDAILALQGLAQERQDTVIFIAPRRQFITQQEERLRVQQLAARTEAVLTQIVPIKYRPAAELQVTLQQHLGGCATISVDQRTNTLIITGTPSCLRLR
jgi:type IV pilus assembly protein PilQ